MSSLETTSSFPERDRWDGLERLLASYSLTELFEAARQHPSPLVTNELQIRIRSKYDSKLGEWDNNSSARSKPRRLLTETEERGKFYFPPELVPFCSHPDLLEIDPDITSRILIQRLYLYMNFTILLEHHAVNPTLLDICHEASGFLFPDEMTFDSMRIYVDEAHHALFCQDSINQVQLVTGQVPIRFVVPSFMVKLADILNSIPTLLRSKAQLYFTIVSETLISAILSTIPNHTGMVPFVREVVADHAADEGKHHAYFVKVLEMTWPQLRPEEQAVIGPLIPQFMMAFLSPDRPALNQLLVESNVPKIGVVPFVREVVADHAADEGKHHAYFVKVLEMTWPQLRPEEQAVIGPLIPQFMMAFLSPDRPALNQLLVESNVPKAKVQDIIEECYPASLVMKEARVAARISINRLKAVGVLDSPEIAEAFYDVGLVA